MFVDKKADFYRGLMPAERALVQDVFHNALPPMQQIGVTNGIGSGGGIWTVDRPFSDYVQGAPEQVSSLLKYLINIGDAATWDLSTKTNLPVPGYRSDRACDVFVHEMTHVVQYYRGEGVKVRSVYAQKLGAGYEFKAGDAWADYNVEQQAEIVETWNKRRKPGDTGEEDELFPYVHYLIRKEGKYRFTETVAGITINKLLLMDLPQLTVLWIGERGFGPTPLPDEPVRITAKDDSFVIVLKADVLFDLNKADVKPQANPALEKAAVTIKASRRLDAVFINGYTDSTGDDAYNMRLSQQRAEAVAQWFLMRGYLSKSVMKTQGFGKSQPIAPNTDPVNRAKNRRVEIYLRNK